MTTFVINGVTSLHLTLGELRSLFDRHKFLKITVRAGKDRSLDQNAISFAWYEQLARELKEENAMGWRCYCKLHHGVPILRADDEEFHQFYDAGLKKLDYEAKLAAMKFVPVTSLMTKQQLSAYLEAVQEDFRKRGVRLEFPSE